MPQVIHLTEPGLQSAYAVVNRTDFNLFKNVTNEVEFLIKDVDRKPVNITNRNLTIHIVDERTNTLVLQSTLTIINGTRGHCRMSLSPSDIAGLSNGYFRYAVTIDRITNINGVDRVDSLLIFTDQYRAIKGYLELLDGPIPNPQPAVEIDPSVFYDESWGDPIQVFKVAGPYEGAAQRDNRSGQHTVAVYMENFSGQFWIEASLENNSPSAQSDWFPVTDQVFNEFTGVKGFQFIGSYMWIRVYYLPGPMNAGTVTKVLLKN